MDITQLILDDHHEQRRLFAILEQIGRADTAALSAVWGAAGHFLELHAAAEEAIFYPALLQVGLAAQAGRPGRKKRPLDAIRDHNDIRDAVAEVARHQVGSDEWFAAVAAANLANSDHMAEEEREGLTDFRRLAGLQQRHDLAVAFAAFQARNCRRRPGRWTRIPRPTSALPRVTSDGRPVRSISAVSRSGDGGAHTRTRWWARAESACAGERRGPRTNSSDTRVPRNRERARRPGTPPRCRRRAVAEDSTIAVFSPSPIAPPATWHM